MTTDRDRRLQATRQRLRDRLLRTWLAHVAVLDTKLGFQHRARAAMIAGDDHGTVCLVRSLVRYLGDAAPSATQRPTVVLMVLHDIFSPCDKYMQAIFTVDTMRRHLQDHEVLSDVHMRREIEAKMDQVPHDHVVVVHLASKEPLGNGGDQRQQYKLSRPHDRYDGRPICHLGQRWFRDMARMVVRDV